MEVYKQALAQEGKPLPEELPVMREIYVAEDSERAYREIRPYLEEKYKGYVEWGQDLAMPGYDRFGGGFDTLARDRFIIGGPEECVAQLKRYEALGFNHIVADLQWPGMPQELVMKSLRLIGERILPQL
jgi:alkanesulfonate monooxygenase SsuD/methylene tetrahydromethanopterin reductase-like flavin-dependent oxidoreductase (luciferase family)